LEQLVSLHVWATKIPNDGDYTRSIQKIIDGEIRPAARQFRNRLEAIHDNLFGQVTKSAFLWLGGSGAVQLLGNLSRETVTGAVVAVAATTLAHVQTARREERVARRECAISYVLDLESHQ
jgi:hypothetical protein